MEHIASHHNDLVGAVVYRGGVTTAFLLGLRAYNERVFVEKCKFEKQR